MTQVGLVSLGVCWQGDKGDTRVGLFTTCSASW